MRHASTSAAGGRVCRLGCTGTAGWTVGTTTNAETKTAEERVQAGTTTAAASATKAATAIATFPEGREPDRREENEARR
jgi:hypothetical protein